MIRKTTPKLFLAIGALTLWAGLASAELMQVVGVATGDTLNVRSGPGAKFADIGDIARNGAVNVLGYNTAGTWAKIRYRGQDAWVSDAKAIMIDATCLKAHRTGSSLGVKTGGLAISEAA